MLCVKLITDVTSKVHHIQQKDFEPFGFKASTCTNLECDAPSLIQYFFGHDTGCVHIVRLKMYCGYQSCMEEWRLILHMVRA